MKYKSILMLCLLTTYLSCTSIKHMDYVDNLNYVPNQETAIKIAEVIWYPIYGVNIEKFKPFKVELKDNTVWIVEGTIKEGKGGVPYIEINKKDCKILKVMHEK